MPLGNSLVDERYTVCFSMQQPQKLLHRDQAYSVPVAKEAKEGTNTEPVRAEERTAPTVPRAATPHGASLLPVAA